MAKRKTLPNDIEEYIKDDQAVKAVFDKCDINAYGGYGKGNIFFYMISEDMIHWCMEQGADINYVDRFGRTALMEHAGISNPEHEKQALLLLENGADISIKVGYMKESVIFYAVSAGNIKAVEALIDAGADLCEKDLKKHTPLEAAFAKALPIDLIKLAPMTEMLLGRGVSVGETMKQEFLRVAKDIEFRRDSCDTDFLIKVDEAMDKLYSLLDVERVPRRVMLDETLPITVNADTWQEQHAELWEMLVPGSGHASTVQGEVVRISGKVTFEILDNGAINWDSDYRELVNALKDYLKMGAQLSQKEYDDIAQITVGIQDRDKEDLYRLTELSVKWVLKNPKPIKLTDVKYRR